MSLRFTPLLNSIKDLLLKFDSNANQDKMLSKREITKLHNRLLANEVSVAKCDKNGNSKIEIENNEECFCFIQCLGRVKRQEEGLGTNLEKKLERYSTTVL